MGLRMNVGGRNESIVDEITKKKSRMYTLYQPQGDSQCVGLSKTSQAWSPELGLRPAILHRRKVFASPQRKRNSGLRIFLKGFLHVPAYYISTVWCFFILLSHLWTAWSSWSRLLTGTIAWRGVLSRITCHKSQTSHDSLEQKKNAEPAPVSDSSCSRSLIWGT